MNTLRKAVLASGALLLAALAPLPALAHTNVGLSIGLGVPVYAAPAPVYYDYAPPPPVYYAPAPRVVYRPGYYVPAAPVYYAPRVVYPRPYYRPSVDIRADYYRHYR